MQNSDLIPTIIDYTKFLYSAVTKFNIDINTARKKYGNFTYKQWNQLLYPK